MYFQVDRWGWVEVGVCPLFLSSWEGVISGLCCQRERERERNSMALWRKGSLLAS